MERSSVIKVIGAFVAGLVVALASALLYVKAHERPAAVTAQMEVAPAAAPAPVVPSVKQEDDAPPPAPPPAVKEEQPPPVRVKATPRKVVKHVVPKSEEPVQVVQNRQPAYAPLPAPPPPSGVAAEAPVPVATAPPVVAAAAPHVVELAAGTNLAIRLGETISTDHNYTGDAFRGTLDQPVIRNGFVIAERGSKVLGKVVEADKAGRVRGVANLNLKLLEINTTDGQRIEVETNSVEKSGQKSTGSDTAKIAGGAALGAIIGALGGGGKGAAIGAGAGGAAGTGVVLATRGKAAVLPSESRLTFQLTAPVTITEKINH